MGAAIHKLHYQFGNHYYKEHSANFSKSIRLQGTHKIGFPAHIHIHKLHVYPEFNVPPNITASLGTRQLKEMSAKRLGELGSINKGKQVRITNQVFCSFARAKSS